VDSFNIQANVRLSGHSLHSDVKIQPRFIDPLSAFCQVIERSPSFLELVGVAEKVAELFEKLSGVRG
jgi:hypothetical protein